ncbi:hypothetical protein ASPFODRAFT_704873 [Aspergillus luchuensis CBS 106.47]|uniref:Xylanolytic transcriptional activator regulatory domain-containing protein n=1 Tax=Aspergillus luchuensis (strain CBS 106.47) TaxID=1137211 RepID=A0A1M3T1H9_ASPLC|nr:hypothetical protein ASPFODRAFT_704873 [Aspergillus luchuensis CBS 106.47]
MGLQCETVRPCILCRHAGRKCETTDRRAYRRRQGLRTQRVPSVENQSPGTAEACNPSHGPTLPGSNVTYSEGTQLGETTSSIDFAQRIFDEEETGRVLTAATLPGDVAASNPNLGDNMWRLQKIKLPSPKIMLTLIDAYFHRMQWFILLFVEPEFRKCAQRIIPHDQWHRRDLGACMAVLAVAAIGLQSVLLDREWPGHELLRMHSIDPQVLLDGLISEIRVHLLDLLEDCPIEAVQVPMLLSCYYVFHKPRLAWTVLGMSVRAAYALDIQHPKLTDTDPVMDEIKTRCWNHLIVADTFTTMVYGRALSIDYAEVRQLRVVDDLTIPSPLLNLFPEMASNSNSGRSKFHIMKAEIYRVVRETLLQFRRLRFGPMMEDKELQTVASIAQESDGNLRLWRQRVPRMFDYNFWSSGGWEDITQALQTSDVLVKEQAETIFLQAAILQLTYDSALIHIHRALLERRVRTTCKPVVEAINKSLMAATTAALRISRIPVHKFQNSFAGSFVSMQQFTAGAILCLQPSLLPFSQAAFDAKAGVMRIIRASRAISYHNRIAKHIEELLTELLRVVNEREMSRALVDDPSDGMADNKMFMWLNPATSRQRRREHDPDSQTSSLPIASATTEELVEPDVWECGIEADFPSDGTYISPVHFPSESILEQLDSTFGAFGELMFNMTPEDQNNIWNWGRTFP